jgi:hypothetical protein
MNDTIFISIASYCDTQLTTTVADCIAKAKYPDRLRFGIMEQEVPEKRFVIPPEYKKIIRYTGVMPAESRGLCWARALGMAMYYGEDWFFSIDAHMVFEQNWDEFYIRKAQECMKFSNKPIITSYPCLYRLVDGKPVLDIERGVKAHVINFDCPFEIVFNPSNYTILAKAITVDTDEILPGFGMACGCIFTLGKYVYEIPYDPQFYFEGEEQAMALRAYTHGWDIFHVPNMPIYHLMERETRTSHWDGEPDKQRPEHWWEFKTRAMERLTQLVKYEDLGVYSLGTKRTLKEYAEFCGLDYENNVIGEKARRGPWVQTLE